MPPSRTEQLVTAFCDGSLPKERWTHQAHLCVGLWHLLHHSAEEALELVRARITAYNESTGGENTDSAGYHETITRFFLGRIGQFLETVDRGRPIDELAEELVGVLGNKGAPLEYYSRERLMSVEARRGWVTPDLRAIQWEDDGLRPG